MVTLQFMKDLCEWLKTLVSRYMLVDGHGNFGSVDGDGAAAMRYTEAKMRKIAVEMLRDINKDTVDFHDNYDGTERDRNIYSSFS